MAEASIDAVRPRPSPAAPSRRPAAAPAQLIDFSNVTFRYEPFPIGLTRPAFDEALYAEMLANYPPIELFAFLPELGHKYVLSSKYNGRKYRDFLRSQPVWREFHAWIKSEALISSVLQVLKSHDIDVGIRRPPPVAKRLKRLVKALRHGRRPEPTTHLSTRFDFSMLPADGGHLLPHTDSPGKLITLVASMVGKGEWDPAFGGGTDVNRAKEPRRSFNHTNRQALFEDMEVLHTYEFHPNQVVLFVKTFNSWHSVRPMRGAGSTAMRRTLTINIEAR